MKLICYFCKQELVEKGALIFSPPYRLDEDIQKNMTHDIVNKFHVCGLCFVEMMSDWKPTPRG